MHRANNAVIMQTEQLGCIEALEEELRSFKEKVTEQDHVITQLMGDNLEHLQDNMCLTTDLRAAKGGSVVGLSSIEREGPAGGRCPQVYDQLPDG